MGKRWRGKGDLAFGLPRATHEKTPVDDARPDPQYRPGLVLYRDQVCYVCLEVIPAGTKDARWASGRRRWRHGDCRWDLMPASLLGASRRAVGMAHTAWSTCRPLCISPDGSNRNMKPIDDGPLASTALIAARCGAAAVRGAAGLC